MFRKCILWRWIISVVMVIGLLCSATALAKKPPAPEEPEESSSAYVIVPFLFPQPPANFESVESSVMDLNDSGNAVGYEEFVETLSDGSYRDVCWALHLDMTTGEYTRLSGLSGTEYPTGVNHSNQIVGERVVGDSRTAVFWSEPEALPIDLPLSSPGATSSALAINSAGIIVGDNDGAVLWRVLADENGDVSFGGGPLPLPPLTGDTFAVCTDVNELIDGVFQVCGHSRGEGPWEAVLWTIAVTSDGSLALQGPPVALGTLGLNDPSKSYGNAVNVFGDVCGSSDGMPYVASATQPAEPLPTPRNTDSGQARDLNKFGDVVGRLTILLKGGRYAADYAYLWSGGEAINLETQVTLGNGWDRLWLANKINDGGIIAGLGGADVEFRGFLLIPTEP